MKIYNEQITLQTENLREILNITPSIKAAMEKSGFRDGIILVSALHSNAAVILNDEEQGLQKDILAWAEKNAPAAGDYQHKGGFESAGGVHLQAILLNPQAVVPFTEGRLDLGPWQFVQYVELDGQRPKRVTIKVMGE